MADAKNEAFDTDAWGKEMAPEGHLGTWDGFVTLSKWAAIAVIGILVFMAVFLL